MKRGNGKVNGIPDRKKYMSRRQNSYRRFNIALSIFAASTAFGIGGLNAVIDPYGMVNSPDISGVNQFKPEQITRVRMFKAAEVSRIQPRSLLMGSSRADIGLDPNHPALADVEPGYNLGLSGANMHEVRQYFEHALYNQPDLDVVVIGLDFFMFNQFKQDEGDFSLERLNQQHPAPDDLVNVLFSLDALESSVQTLRFNLRPSPSSLYDATGRRYQFGDFTQASEQRFRQMTTRLLETHGYYQDYELSQDYLADLEAVVDLAAQHDIELHLFISPSHATLTESLYQAGLWPEYAAWKQALVAIAPIWNFAGYNSVTTERISDEMMNYVDSSHYSTAVGNLMLNRMLDYRSDEVPNDFGQLLSASTLDAHLREMLASRDQWQQAATNEMQLVYLTDRE